MALGSCALVINIYKTFQSYVSATNCSCNHFTTWLTTTVYVAVAISCQQLSDPVYVAVAKIWVTVYVAVAMVNQNSSVIFYEL